MNLLFKTPALSGMSVPALENLSNAITVMTFKRGQNLLERGYPCNHIYFIEKGYLRTFMLKDGLEINTAFHFENAFSTNIKSLRTGSYSDTTIQAGERTVVYAIDKHILLALYAESPEIESFGRKLLEQLLIAQEEHTNLFRLYTPAERYKYLQTHQPQLIKRVSLSQLSSYLGVARETLSRIRRVL